MESNLEWHHVSPERVERGLDLLEAFYAAMQAAGAPLNRTQFALTSTIRLKTTLEGDEFVKACQNAWVRLRYEQPSLASYLMPPKLVYKIATEDELQTWLAETFIIVNDPTTTQKARFKELRPVERCTLYVLPATKELMFRSAHDRIDAIGLLNTIDLYLQLLTQKTTPPPLPWQESQRLCSSQYSVANITPSEWIMSSEATRLVDAAVDGKPPLGLPVYNAKAIPGGTNLQELVFSVSETQAVIQASKRLGLTVGHLFQAAFIFATRDMATDDDTNNYFSWLILDSRRHFLPGKTDRDWQKKVAFSAYFLPWPIQVEPTQDFISTAERCKEQYTTATNDKDVLFKHPGLLEPTQRFFNPERPVPPTDPILSSLGIVENHVQRVYSGSDIAVEVEDFWCAMEQLGHQVHVSFWTFRDQIHLLPCYNEEYHQPTVVQDFLDLVKKELFHGIGFEQ